MRIYVDPSKIKQLLMTSFPVENDDESKNFSVRLKILSWTFTCNNQICIIWYLLGPGITGLRPCFQFLNWKKNDQNGLKLDNQKLIYTKSSTQNPMSMSVFSNREVWKILKTKVESYQCDLVRIQHWAVKRRRPNSSIYNK